MDIPKEVLDSRDLTFVCGELGEKFLHAWRLGLAAWMHCADRHECDAVELKYERLDLIGRDDQVVPVGTAQVRAFQDESAIGLSVSAINLYKRLQVGRGSLALGVAALMDAVCRQ